MTRNEIIELAKKFYTSHFSDREIAFAREVLKQAEKQWQGLTEEELWELWESNTEPPFPEWFVDFKRAYKVIEAKLKEKNT